MFSGLRSLVEDLAQPQPRPARTGRSSSQDFSPERPGSVSRSSFDLSSASRNITHTTGNLAESAITNLRKSLASQRPFVGTSPDGRGSPKPERELRPVSKPTLEDRLRASFAIGEASNATTPDGVSHVSSPKPMLPQSEKILSPRSTPLPDSPADSPRSSRSIVASPSLQPVASPIPTKESSYFDPLQVVSSETVDVREEEAKEDVNGGAEVDDEAAVGKGAESFRETGKEVTMEQQTEPIEGAETAELELAATDAVARIPEADVPLPPFSPEPTNLAASQSSRPLIPDEAIQMDNTSADTLKRVVSSLEQRLAETTTSLEELRSHHDTANGIIGQFTPIKKLTDIVGLRHYLQDMHAKHDLSQDELKKLQNKLRTYDERIEELRDTHRLESRSHSELVNNLRKQLEETEALLKAAEKSSGQVEEETRIRQEELDRLRSETQKFKDVAKEEEEKRVKAISLLKTVRQKLVKAEKEREETTRELAILRETDKAEREKEKLERARLENAIEGVRIEKEKDIAGLKAHFDKELETVKDKLEKEFQARRGQLELEMMSLKATQQKDLASKNSKIQTLENSVRSLNNERDNLFDQLQLRQAELESSQSRLESLDSSQSELQFQLREATERNAVLSEELSDVRRELEYRESRPSTSNEDSSKLRTALEAKYESRLSDLNAQLSVAEKERSEIESALSRSLQQKTQENEELRKAINSAAERKGVSEEEVNKLKSEIEDLNRQVISYKEQLKELNLQQEKISELENLLHTQAADLNGRVQQAESEAKEAKERETQIKAANKSLREELRKVQSSAALLERQRNPGVGYWSTIGRQENSSDARLSSPPPNSSGSTLSRTASPAPVNSDEEVNLEYLRNVILQFLEHKEMRPHLVRVLSIILHFTPQETRRLVAKVT